MKTCTRCKATKPLSEFYVRKSAKDGRESHCRECAGEKVRLYHATHKEATKAYKIANKERSSIVDKAYRESHKAETKARTSKWSKLNLERRIAANRESRKISRREWSRANPHLVCQQAAKRRAVSRQATPKWANRFFIQEAYHLAALRTKLTGIDWHVDHIVPLNSPLVCGLHCEANLAVIPAKENLSKSNRQWPNMPI